MENKFMHPAEIDQRYRFSMVGSYEQLPHSTIADVVINHDMAKGVTDPNLLKWFDEEYLIKRAAIFGLSRTDGPIHRIKTPTSIRSVYLQRDSFFTDEYGNGYGAISAKGTGVVPFLRREFLSKDPEGFFGKVHAEAEQEVSEALSSYGARVGRVIGHIELDPDKLEPWLYERQAKKDYDATHQLRKVVEEGDKPAIMVRLEGADRLADFDKRRYYNSGLKAFERTARLHLREIASREGIEGYLDHYGLNNLPFLKDALEYLERIAREDRPLGPIKFNPYSQINFLYYYFTELNYLIARKVSYEKYDGKLTLKNEPQDIDLAGYWYDFETSTPQRPQYDKDIERYSSLERSHPSPPVRGSTKTENAKKLRAHSLAVKHLKRRGIIPS